MLPKLNNLELDQSVPFKVVAPFEPMGDQPQAIDELAAGIENGQEAQVLAGLHRRPGEDDPVDLLGPEVGHGGGHGQVGLAGARRPHPQGDGVLLNGLDILYYGM